MIPDASARPISGTEEGLVGIGICAAILGTALWHSCHLSFSGEGISRGCKFGKCQEALRIVGDFQLDRTVVSKYVKTSGQKSR